MTGTLRYLLATAFLGLLLLVPAADGQRLAFLQVRTWLMSGSAEDGPLAALRAGHPHRIDERPHVVDGGLLQPVASPIEGPKLGPLPPILFDIHPEELRDEVAAVVKLWIEQNGVETNRALPATGLRVLVGADQVMMQFRMTTHEGREHALAGQTIPFRNGDVLGHSYRPDRWSLLPAFLAIALAILTGRIIPSLLCGCMAGSLLFAQGDPIAAGRHLVAGTLRTVLVDDFKLKIMAFVVFLFMAVGVMTRSGGIQGMVEWIRRYARGPVSTQICSFVVGLLVFFDDYTNCVLTGSTMRPLTDRNRVSREKLAYIVDSTAAPIAGICIFSTWVAYEISMFAPQLTQVVDERGLPYRAEQGFDIFLQTLPYRFYCIFTLIMVLLTIVLQREFGPMLGAERRARAGEGPTAADARPMVAEGFRRLEPQDSIPHRARNALLPILTLVLVTIGLFYHYGADTTDATRAAALQAARSEGIGSYLRAILQNTDSTMALLWASASAFVVASVLALIQGLMTLRELAGAALRSAAALGFAVVILILAWAIGRTCEVLGTNLFLTAAFGQSFSPWLLPAIMFLLSALVSFSTGTSYGTMAILLPNVVVLAHQMGTQYPGFGGPALMVITIGAVLEGSIFGDHCSPISDTTVLSSMATSCDHLHHVRTQAPYAIVVMLVSLVCGYLPAALFGGQWSLAAQCALTLGTGVLAMTLCLLVAGRRVGRPAPM